MSPANPGFIACDMCLLPLVLHPRVVYMPEIMTIMLLCKRIRFQSKPLVQKVHSQSYDVVT